MPPAVTTSRNRGSMSALKRSARINGFVFTLPVFILLLLVVALPLSEAIFFSFTNWNGRSADFVGIRNYAIIFSNPDLQRTVLNSVILVASIPIGMVGPFVIAYLLSGGIPLGRLFRSLIFAPTALSWIVVGLVARSFFGNEGAVNTTLEAVGLGAFTPNWLADSTLALVALVITVNVSIFGINTIIFLTGFSSLDRSMLEAARVDGAGGIRILVDIVLPSMRRFVEFVLIITIVLTFSGIFGLIYVMTAGGPGFATTTLEFAIYQRAFSTGDYGLSTALGVFLMVLILGVISIIRLYGRRHDND